MFVKDLNCVLSDRLTEEKWLKFLNQSIQYSKDEIYAYQLYKLKETLEYAYKYVPYYRKLFDDCGFDPTRFKYIDNIRKIPFLTKNIVQENKEKLVSKQKKRCKWDYFTTGGSTGIPTGFYSSHNIVSKENAFFRFIYKEFGFDSRRSRYAVLRGTFIGSEEQAYVKHKNVLYLSSYYMTERNMKLYLEQMEQEKIEYIRAYPSALYFLARYMTEAGRKANLDIKYIFLASENVYPEQRKLIEKVFSCKTFSHYGHVERVCLAPEREHNQGYHFMWQYGFTELLNSSDMWGEQENENVEIVGTSFDNYGMPLIRYRTMDFAQYAKSDDGRYKTNLCINKINGRLQEVLVTKTGRYISMTSINMHSPVFDNVVQFQFYQDSPEYCVFNIVRNSRYTPEDEIQIKKELGDKLGSDIEMRIRYVEKIDKTVSGKYRFLIQKLPVIFDKFLYQ